MAEQFLVADDPTITAMGRAFDECKAEYVKIQAAVDSAVTNLNAQWQSDEAAPRYRQAIQQWLQGFRKVQDGLNALDASMQSYRQHTTRTEGEIASLAGGWATT